MSQKKETWDWCSRYCRLRDALEYCKEHGIDLGQFVRVEDIIVGCCSCNATPIAWIRRDAGHFIPRGKGGMSGVYYDERNINAQCTNCNLYTQGNAQGYTEFMLHKYGQKIIDELKVLDKIQSYKYKLIGLEMFYRQRYEEMVRSFEVIK